jgi:hypothetical protein
MGDDKARRLVKVSDGRGSYTFATPSALDKATAHIKERQGDDGKAKAENLTPATLSTAISEMCDFEME